MFGRLAADHPVEVVPGVSSLTACAAALGAPLSAKNDVLSVVPGPLAADRMSARLAEADAAAVIKVGRHLPKIRGVLDDLGLTQNARYIELTGTLVYYRKPSPNSHIFRKTEERSRVKKGKFPEISNILQLLDFEASFIPHAAHLDCLLPAGFEYRASPHEASDVGPTPREAAASSK